jgi:predicted transcriptional regulator
MKPVCEVMVSEILPGVRALVAGKLVEKHSFSQMKAAERLGTTQPAISQYRAGIRGSGIKKLKENAEFMGMVESIADRTASGELSHDMITMEFCRLCRFMRKEGLACEFHRRLYPSLKDCRICMEE